MAKLIHFDKLNTSNIFYKKLNTLIKKHLGTTPLDDGYIFVNKKEIIGYVILQKNKIDWIYSQRGYGTKFLKRIEQILFKKYDKIVLNVSVDPNEKKDTIIRRVNFYIKNNYRVNNIKFRKKYGPLFYMYKNKK